MSPRRFGGSRPGAGPVLYWQEPRRPRAVCVDDCFTRISLGLPRQGRFVLRSLVHFLARCRPQILGQAAGPVPCLWPVPRVCVLSTTAPSSLPASSVFPESGPTSNLIKAPPRA